MEALIEENGPNVQQLQLPFKTSTAALPDGPAS
jgi:hypothetical protein